MYKKVQKRQIDASRVALLRINSHMKQSTLAQEISRLSSRDKEYSQTVVSMWETGRRPVPIELLPILRDMFGVTECYLCGETNDPTSNTPDNIETPESDVPLNEIRFGDLYAFDEQPLYIEFPRKQHVDGWAIYSRNKHCFVFVNDVVKEVAMDKLGAMIYTRYPDRLTNAFAPRKSLDLGGLMRRSSVYICMISADNFIRGRYDGWYRHNEDYTALINNNGLVLPYSGLNYSYYAYAFAKQLGNDEEISD